MVALPKDDGEPTIREIIEGFIADAGGIGEKAHEAVMSRIARDRKFRQVFIDGLLSAAVYDEIQQAIHHARAAAWRHDPRPDNTSGLWLIAAEDKQNLMSFPIRGGKAIAQATAGEIEVDADYREKAGRTSLHIARWERMIAGQLHEGQHVEDVLSEADLQQLQREAGLEN